MTRPAARILVVEDNPVTREMIRGTLAAGGYQVIEAPDGRSAIAHVVHTPPELVLLDLLLPDISGVQLVARLRALPGAAHLPVLALTGFMQGEEEVQALSAGFNEYLVKPIEPVRLLEVVRAYVGGPTGGATAPEAGKRILVVDDDPGQLALTRLQLARLGYVVETARDGLEALESARASAPDAIVSDVLMPRLDGFKLCRAIRQEPALRRIPIVLQSNHYAEDADRDLARRLGANAYITRSASIRTVAAELRAAFAAPEPPPFDPSINPDQLDYSDRIVQLLERQAGQNTELLQRTALQGAALAVLGSTADALARREPVAGLLEETLYRCIDVAGVSVGVFYEAVPAAGFVARTVAGSGSGPSLDVEACFGHPELLQQVLDSQSPLALPTGGPADALAVADMLARLRLTKCLLVPVVFRDEPLGVLLLASSSRDLAAQEWIGFARVVSGQIGQALTLSRAIDELRESEARHRAVIDYSFDGFAISDQGTVREANRGFANIFGYSIDEVTGKPLLDFVAPESREAVSQRIAAGSEGEFDLIGLRKDGRRLHLETVAKLYKHGGQELRITAIRDVTERRELEQQFRQAQKMEAVGRLAGGVAHDFNNLLTVITSYGQLLLEDLPEGDGHRGDVEQILKAAHGAATLTRQLLAFSRQQVLEPKVLNLNTIVAGAGQMLKRLIGEDVVLVTALADDLGAVKTDPGQIEQVIVNLAVNARDAMPHGGKLTIETVNVHLDRDYTIEHRAVTPGQYIVLSVTDTGVGMDEATQARLFEPFFTTKEQGKGTGLGLATVYGIVKQSGGFIWVYSELGHGTTFKIYLPRVTETLSAPVATLGLEAIRGTETILLAEDAAGVRNVAHEILRRQGYNVLVATDGRIALEVAAAHPEPIHLLVTDVIMPEMSGRQLADRLKEQRPGLKVLFVSGYTDDAIVRHGMLEPGIAFLQKPFTPQVLARKVREVLG